MKQNIRTLIREFIQESELMEDYPASFDMEVFKSLKSHAGRNKYAQEHLQRLSSGSSRIVYKIDDEKVLKLAKNDKGVAQNEVEIEYGQYNDIKDIVAKIFDYDEQNNLWVEMELARKVKISDFKNIVGYNFEDIKKAIHNVGVDSGMLRRIGKYEMNQELVDDMWENEFTQELFSFIGNYQIPVGDLQRLSSYGVVKRDGQDTIVLIDYGLTHDVYSSYYS
jgi:mRNA-degrading endonuclease RelE of RelBE toxin-antitoxin system